MSSYIVETKTISRIISYLRHFGESWEKRELEEIGYNFGLEGCAILGNAMLALNKIATGMRYDENYLIIETEYKFETKLVSKIQALKSLQCFLYQCNEGTADESKLFKTLEKVRCNLAERIVSELESYDEAEWG